MSSSTVPVATDTRPLTDPVDEAAITAFAAEARASGSPWRRITTGLPHRSIVDIAGQLMPSLVPGVALVFFAVVGGTDLAEAIAHFTVTAPFPLNLVVVGVLVLVVVGVVTAALHAARMIRSLLVPRSWWESIYRLTRFASVNALRYGHDEPVSYPGVIFTTGQERTAERRLTTTSGRRVEIGNYRYTETGGDNNEPRVFGWGYVSITLDRMLPHLLLDAKANNTSVFGIRTTNLPVDLAPDQQLALGGEFDDKFTLYAPSGYGQDAFYVFTPDLMALFIDRLGAFDVEIVDDTMYLYGGRFDLHDPATYAWLNELVETVVSRTVRRTERYTDDRALLVTDPTAVGASASGVDAPTEESRSAQDFVGVFAGIVGITGSPRGPVFSSPRDGEPRTATNAVAEGGRRLRGRRFGRATVVAILIIGFWAYQEIIGPMLGLPIMPGG